MKHNRVAFICTLSLCFLLCACNGAPASTNTEPPTPMPSQVNQAQSLAAYQGEGFSFSYDSDSLEVKELDDDAGLMVSLTGVGNLSTIPRADFLIMDTPTLSPSLASHDFEAFVEDVVKAYYPASITDNLIISFNATTLNLGVAEAQNCSTTVTVGQYTDEDGAVYPEITANAQFQGNGETGIVSVFVYQTELEAEYTSPFVSAVDSLAFN